MASNTFSLPKAAKSILLSRVDYNDSLQALLQCFRSENAPTSVNITIEDTATNPLNGMLWISKTTGSLYKYDTNFAQSHPLYGSFTVNGIGSRLEPSLASANVSTYEKGELMKTAETSSNARIYMKIASGSFVDIGIPAANTVTPAMLSSGFDLGDLS